MQIEGEIRKMQNAIAALNKKVDSISERVLWIEDDTENTHGEVVCIQTKLDVLLGYPLTFIQGSDRKYIQQEQPGNYKKIIEAEEAAGMPPWEKWISLENYLKMLKNGYGTRKSSNVTNDIKEPTRVDSVDKKAMIRHALTTSKTIKEISAETGIPERTVYRILHAMLEAGEIQSDNERPEKFIVVNPSPNPPFEVAKV